MLALITGAAGFIGSTLTERLLDAGWNVRGVDCFTPYYAGAEKRRNLATVSDHERCEFVEADLLDDPLEPLLADVTVVFHLAGQPGVRLSWADGFSTYSDLNLLVTQRLLEAVRVVDVDRFVFASSSSVYGQTTQVPTPESAPTRPYSPYGVTKLAAEHLCSAYAANFGVPTVNLRFFTVYGPRQRPDMAIRRLIDCAVRRTPFHVFGDGTQIRDFTYVGDVVAAMIRAASADVEVGTSINVAGGASTRLIDVIDAVGDAAGEPVPIDWRPAEPGDVFETGGDITRAHELLGWVPETSLRDGIAAQLAWQLTLPE